MGKLFGYINAKNENLISVLCNSPVGVAEYDGRSLLLFIVISLTDVGGGVESVGKYIVTAIVGGHVTITVIR